MSIDLLPKVRKGTPPLQVLVDCCDCHDKYLIYEGGDFECPSCRSRSGCGIARELPDGWRAFNRGSVKPL